MTWHHGEFRSIGTSLTRSYRWLAAGVAGAAIMLLVGTAISSGMAQAATARSLEVRALAVAENSSRVGIGATGLDLAAARGASAVAAAQAELDRASSLLVVSDGKAQDASRTALALGVADLESALDAQSETLHRDAVQTLRELQKTVGAETLAWEAAEAARIAAEAAQAAEAARVEAERQAAASSEAASNSWTESSSSDSAPAASAAAPAPSAPTPPANDDCGPCPGATLVPIEWEGQTYWGCP